MHVTDRTTMGLYIGFEGVISFIESYIIENMSE